MSTLTAVKLERKLENICRIMAGDADRPRLVMQWRVDPATGRAVGIWAAQHAMATPAALPETVSA